MDPMAKKNLKLVSDNNMELRVEHDSHGSTLYLSSENEEFDYELTEDEAKQIACSLMGVDFDTSSKLVKSIGAKSEMASQRRRAANTVKSNATQAAWRSAALSVTKSVRAPLIAAVCKKLTPDQAQTFQAFMKTAEGRGLLSLILGAIPLFVPQLQVDSRMEKLAEELRIAGLQVASDKIFDVALAPIVAAFTSATQKLPIVAES